MLVTQKPFARFCGARHSYEELNCALGFKKVGNHCSKGFRSQYTLTTLFNSLIRSKLEYCCIIWDPLYKKFVKKIDSIQRKFLKYSKYLLRGRQSYADILNPTNNLSLEKRRKFHKIMFIYKILNNFVDSNRIIETLTFHVPQRNTRQKKLFFVKSCKTNYAKSSPFTSMLKLFNDFYHLDPFVDNMRHFRQQILQKLTS